MIQRGQQLRFALEPGQPLRIVRKRFGQDFDGHVAPELGVVRLVHFAHPARTDERDNLVGSQMCASRQRHFLTL